MEKIYFLDTYAMFEIILGNKKYAPYDSQNVLTTKLNLMELFYGLLRKFGEKIAIFFYEQFSEYTINYDDESIQEACKLKLTNNKLSYVDCIGYVLAQKNKAKFLTGDKAFKNMDNVEYVK